MHDLMNRTRGKVLPMAVKQWVFGKLKESGWKESDPIDKCVAEYVRDLLVLAAAQPEFHSHSRICISASRRTYKELVGIIRRQKNLIMGRSGPRETSRSGPRSARTYKRIEKGIRQILVDGTLYSHQVVFNREWDQPNRKYIYEISRTFFSVEEARSYRDRLGDAYLKSKNLASAEVFRALYAVPLSTR